MALKIKIGLGFVVVLFVFLALVVFGNVAAIKNIPPPSSYLVAEETKSGDVALQQIAEPTRYFNNPDSIASIPLTANLTRELADQLSLNFIEKNPNGPRLGDNGQVIQVPSLEASVNTTLELALNKFDKNYFLPKISGGDIKVIANNEESINYYLSTLQYILKEKGADLQYRLDAKNWQADLKKAVSTYDDLLARLYQLPTPKQLSQLQQQIISLTLGKKRVFEALLNQEADPVQAILAMPFLETIDEEFKKLKVE